MVFPLINFEQVQVLYIGLKVDSVFSGCCVAQNSHFCYYRVSVMRIDYNMIDEKVNIVCITPNSANAVVM